jgi:hypothetical protein
MSEADVVQELVEFTTILLAGVSVYFTIVSAYTAAMNYFIGGAAFVARFFAYVFVSMVLTMLVIVMMGAAQTHAGLIARLEELHAAGELTAVGRALLANADASMVRIMGHAHSIDEIVRSSINTVLGSTYLVLFYMTFFHRWKPEIMPIQVVQGSNVQ